MVKWGKINRNKGIEIMEIISKIVGRKIPEKYKKILWIIFGRYGKYKES